jgi:hypothetical protein
MVSKMLHDSTQRSDAKWVAHLLACRKNIYIARLGQLHPHPAQRVANDDHVRSLAENMEESAVLKFQHPLEVVLDNDDALLDLPPLSHLPTTTTASILRGQHRHLAYTLFLRKQIFAASSAGEYMSPLDIPDCVALNHPDATWPCVVYSHGGVLHYDGAVHHHTLIFPHILLGLLHDEFELDLATFIHDDNQKLLSLEATITDMWRINSRKPLMTAIEDLYASRHKSVAYCMWHPKLKTVLDTFMASPVMCDWITKNTFTILSTGGTQGVSLVEAITHHLSHSPLLLCLVVDLGCHLRRMRPVSTPLSTPT